MGGDIFRTCPHRPWGPPSLLYNGYRVFPGGKERPGRDADPSPPSSAVVMKGYSYTSTPPMGRTACTEPQCLYRVHFTLPLPIYSATLIQRPNTSDNRNPLVYSTQDLPPSAIYRQKVATYATYKQWRYIGV